MTQRKCPAEAATSPGAVHSIPTEEIEMNKQPDSTPAPAQAINADQHPSDILIEVASLLRVLDLAATQINSADSDDVEGFRFLLMHLENRVNAAHELLAAEGARHE